MTFTPMAAAADSIDAPTPESMGSSSSTVAPWVMSDSACASSVASLPRALGMMNWLRRGPPSCRGEAVAGTRLGDEQRLVPGPLELGPQPPDVHPGVLGLRLVAGTPDPAQQGRVGQQFPRAHCELAEQRELGRGQVDQA